MALDELLTTDQLAEFLGKSRAAVYALRYRGFGPPAVRIGGELRFRRSAVEQWLDSLQETPSIAS